CETVDSCASNARLVSIRPAIQPPCPRSVRMRSLIAGLTTALLVVAVPAWDATYTIRVRWSRAARGSSPERDGPRELRGTLPACARVDAAGTPASDDGALFWRVRFGTVCASGLEMRCEDGRSGARRCRGD